MLNSCGIRSEIAKGFRSVTPVQFRILTHGVLRIVFPVGYRSVTLGVQ